MDTDSARANGQRILIVEDNDDFRLLLQLMLVDEGFVVDAASCAEDAARLLTTRDYQLVLSDYSLPVHSGAWLLSQATRYPHRQVPFAIITGDPDAPGIPRDVVVIPKPLDFDRLLMEVRRMLHKGTESVPIGVRSRRDRAFTPLPYPHFDSSASA